MNDVIARYLDCWNETDPAARRKLIDEVWAADAEYIDPMAEARGRAAIDATIGAVQDQFPAWYSPWPGRSTPTTARRASAGAWVPRAPSRWSSASTSPSPTTRTRSPQCSDSSTRCRADGMTGAAVPCPGGGTGPRGTDR